MDLTRRIKEIKQKFQASRGSSVEERLMSNRKNFENYNSRHLELASSRENHSGGMLSTRINSPHMKINGLPQVSHEKDCTNEEVVEPSISVKLPYLEKIPHYTTWTYLARNQMMPEEESVIGKTIIYYQDDGIETFACSDSEEEIAEQERQKHNFTEEDDLILRMADTDFGLTADVLKILKQFVGASLSEIQERCKILKAQNHGLNSKESDSEWPKGFLRNHLSEALDSFDSLFCRRCLVFDCRLHGCSQVVINSSEKRPYSSDFEDEENPCGDQCYLLDHSSQSGSSRKKLKTTLQSSDSMGGVSLDCRKTCYWKPIENDLVLKGIEMFGKRSCLIARNLLPGLRTCKEVFNYMDDVASSIPDNNDRINNERRVAPMPARGRVVRKKRGNRKIKFSLKSARPPSNIKRNIGDKNTEAYKQYTPCECFPLCGHDCPCLLSETCCEKYCGCSKSCKNKFRGCYCPKSQCRSQQCPCFAIGRECDPDVCRNCWVSCGGDLSLGEPPRQGDGPCENMKLLLKQQQTILLGRSDVSGWGAFIKNPANKNDYLGEYTGEVISHREAEKRGKVYDRTGSSYLFNLNDQYVLDAYRRGNKLKYANHSFEPNCYAKVMFCAGDHRIGIYANDNIEAGKEVFYDYQYLPGVAPSWAKKPEPDAPTEKNDSPTATPKGPTRKHPH